MKIYVITCGEYSDYRICSVTLDKDKAKILAEKYSYHSEKAEIEIYDTDNEEIVLKYENVYSCWWYEKTKEIRVTKSEFNYLDIRGDLKVSKFRDGLYVYVLADKEDDALKKASDMFAKYRAEKEGL